MLHRDLFEIALAKLYMYQVVAMEILGRNTPVLIFPKPLHQP